MLNVVCVLAVTGSLIGSGFGLIFGNKIGKSILDRRYEKNKVYYDIMAEQEREWLAPVFDALYKDITLTKESKEKMEEIFKEP